MENASKALLIAAGVLIVILLIAFGMSIFKSTGDTSAVELNILIPNAINNITINTAAAINNAFDAFSIKISSFDYKYIYLF